MVDYKGKTIYTCAVNGCLGKPYPGAKYSGMCPRIGCSTNRCHAHGNTKCTHKVKQEKTDG